MSEYHFSCKSNTLTNKHQLSANFHLFTETYCRGWCHCCWSHCHASSLSNYLWSQASGWACITGKAISCREHQFITENPQRSLHSSSNIKAPLFVYENCSSQPSLVHWLSSHIFPCSLSSSLSRYGNTRPNLTSCCPTPPNPYIFWKLIQPARWER